MSETSFLEHFSLALREALTEREQAFVDLRYGLASGEPSTLEQVAQAFSLSRERIRQVLDRSLRKIRHRGRRELRAGKTTGACAALLHFVEHVCQPQEQGYQERIWQFVQEELPHLPHKTWAFPLVLALLFPETEAKSILKELLRLDGEATAEQRQQTKKHKLASEFRHLFSQTLWPRHLQADPIVCTVWSIPLCHERSCLMAQETLEAS